MRSNSQIRTCRDIIVLRSGKSQALVIACDSAGGIGPKSLDRVHVSGEAVGRFTARVALMEVLSVGASPLCMVGTLSVELNPTGARVIHGIRSELRYSGLKVSVPIMRSSEKNIPVRQTGAGVTVLATASCRALKIGKSKQGDLVVAIGLPHVGSEVITGEKTSRIADTRDVLTLLKIPYIHEIIPVGSRGILKEANVIAEDSGLKFRLLRPERINVRKSAGPATVLLCSIHPSKFEDLFSLIDKPSTLIGILEN